MIADDSPPWTFSDPTLRTPKPSPRPALAALSLSHLSPPVHPHPTHTPPPTREESVRQAGTAVASAGLTSVVIVMLCTCPLLNISPFLLFYRRFGLTERGYLAHPSS